MLFKKVLFYLVIFIFSLSMKVFSEEITKPEGSVYKVKFYTGDYKDRQEKAFQDGAICYVEQHFNATEDPNTNYVIVLITDKASSFTRSWAQLYADKLSEKFGIPKGYDNGIKVIKDGDRGYGNLRHSKMPAILLEPFFLSNAKGLEWGKTRQDELAQILVESIYKLFPQGGLVAFSVGHKYKVTSPKDRGAGPFDGIQETDLIEPVMEKAAFILDKNAVSSRMEALAHYTPLFDEVCNIIEKKFYSPEFIKEKFPSIKEKYREKAIKSSYDREFGKIINNMLSEFQTSHTAFYTSDEPEYYHLAAIFNDGTPEIQKLFDNKEILYPATGIFTKEIVGKTFIFSIFEGSVAQKAGLLRGDEIISVDGKPFFSLKSFFLKKDGVVVKVKRTEKSELLEVKLVPPVINPLEECRKADIDSIKIFEEKGKKIGYIHIWSLVGKEHINYLMDMILHDKLKDTDSIIIDIRDGWGGGSGNILNLFNDKKPVIESTDRDGKKEIYCSYLNKPAVLLINERVRSGKEVMAYSVKENKLALLIGEKTPGALLGGSLFVMSDGSILYLPVCDIKINGERLEGIGIEPDITVPVDIRYSEGNDIQMEKAKEHLMNN